MGRRCDCEHYEEDHEQHTGSCKKCDCTSFHVCEMGRGHKRDLHTKCPVCKKNTKRPGEPCDTCRFLKDEEKSTHN